MARSALSLSNAYTARLSTFERSRTKMEALFSNGDVNNRDMNLFYEGIYLRTVTTFEGFVEDLFFGLLTGRIDATRSFHTRINFKSTAIARDVVFASRQYVDWLPYDRTLERAEIYFRGGRPFSILDNSEKAILQRMIIIRNIVAHKSDAAQTKFEKTVLGTTPLLSRERTPAGYLRSIFRTNPAQTRYEDIATSSILIARKLCS